MKKKFIYESPVVEAMDVEIEGVFCASGVGGEGVVNPDTPEGME